ncbi:AAA family ATPase [Rhodobium gokarnense]|uniref:ATPase n=1 Tax=Rhodobium gokarnense TaxID=364296 RepID=A0ABT3HIL1_9HYPH|nr:AAA family ATPase [Rhodobium gokarnense]MCW2310224.1 putative ATPase [Rhodobium gokarnense]
MSKRFVVISGCSGGGKSTLVAELGRRGYGIVEEPGRRVVEEERAAGGTALPWVDMEAFLRRAIDMALADRAGSTSQSGWVFFDRGLVDAASALEALTGEPILAALGAEHRYHPCVFLAPPWPEIYGTDADRRHGFDEAEAEYRRLTHAFPRLGYETVILPKAPTPARADFVLSALAELA